MTQESDLTGESPIETTQAPSQEVAAVETSSPDVTEGASSSDAAASQDQSGTERIVDEFLKKFGDGTTEKAEAPVAQEASDAERNPAPDAKDSKVDQTVAKDDDDDDKHRISDEVFKALPEGVKQRIGHLNTAVKKARRDMEAMQAQTKPVIERMQQLESFVRDNRIEPQNLSRAFGMMAKLSSGDFQGFLTDIRPFVSMAEQATGTVFAPDLADKVDSGEMSEATAKVITQQRIALAREQAKARSLEQVQTRQVQQTQASQNVRTIVDVVNAREAELRASDPDYPALKSVVDQQMKVLLSHAVPKTKEQALKMVNDAYDLAKSVRAQAKPSLRETIPQPTTSTVAKGKPSPKSVKDAILNGFPG
jgi:hypothetical protein